MKVRTISAALAILWLLTGGTALSKAATITVTTTADSGPGSLRAAIASAAPGDTINFNLSYPATITLASTLSITTSLTITGPGASNLAISGNNAVQVLSISGAITVNISGVTIENGKTTGFGGGGISNSGATLSLTSSVVSGNTSSQNAGGIFNLGGNMTITGSTVSGNSASASVGGILNGDGYTYSSMTIADTTVSGNSSTYWGGGLLNNFKCNLILLDSTVSNNGNGYPGGGMANFGTMDIERSTISSNSAGYDGGGVVNNGVLTVTNSTFSGNHSYAGPGAGFSNGDGGNGTVGATATLVNTTFTGNDTSNPNYLGGAIAVQGGSVVLKSTILANSGFYYPATTSNTNCYVGPAWGPGTGTLTSDGYNLSDDSSCSAYLSQPSDSNGSPAGLDSNGLQNNGGATETVALTATSPAIDIIPASACTDTDGNLVATDQRGVPRPFGSGCDVGAFEYVPAEGADPGPSIASATGNISSPIALGTASTLTTTFTDVGFSSDTYTLTILWDGTNSLTASTGTPTTTVTIANATSGNPTVTSSTSGSVGAFGPCTGSYNSSDPSFTVNCSYTYPTDGVYTIDLSAVDEDGNGVNEPSNPYAYQYAVIYNPNAGFVTGGGWINSPAGACTGFLNFCTPNLAGKANFGFVSKYQTGASVPSGDTQFQFQAGDLNFHSNTYQWLVVAGGMAQYKGSQGTINGSGNYDFLLTACDAKVTGTCAGGSSDTFRIKIWDNATGSTVYDNMLGQSDTDTPTTAIGGGAIVIHK